MSGRQNFMYPQTACSGEINIMYLAAACPHGDVVKKTNSYLKATNNTIQMDTNVNFSYRGMFSFNLHFSDNCNVTISIKQLHKLNKMLNQFKRMFCCCVQFRYNKQFMTLVVGLYEGLFSLRSQNSLWLCPREI